MRLERAKSDRTGKTLQSATGADERTKLALITPAPDYKLGTYDSRHAKPLPCEQVRPRLVVATVSIVNFLWVPPPYFTHPLR